VAFVAAVLATAPFSQQVMGLLIGSTVIVAVGILDDLYQLAAKVKLVGQIVAAATLLFFDIRIDWVMNPFSGELIYFEWLAIPITIFWIVGLTNTVNLIDGLDGLAAGVSTIAALSIFFIAADMGNMVVAMLLVSLAGSAIGFLRYNMNPARVFMGDTGSMFLGYVLAAVSIIGAVKSAATIALIVPIVALGLPILDTAFAILRRKLSGEPIFKPDKGHLHHRLLAMGLSQKQAVWLM
jgi:UDP-GlcNAc:undecaprenyl-phosphate GlcNAc-1-phosphate transferase